jgi:hypothetical protein
MAEAPVPAWDAHQVVGSLVPTDPPDATLTPAVHRSRLQTAWLVAVSAVALDVVVVAWGLSQPWVTGVSVGSETEGFTYDGSVYAARNAVRHDLGTSVWLSAVVGLVIYATARHLRSRPASRRGTWSFRARDTLRGDALAALAAIIIFGIGGGAWAEETWPVATWLGDDRWVVIPAMAASVALVRWSLLVGGTIVSMGCVEAIHAWLGRRRGHSSGSA